MNVGIFHAAVEPLSDDLLPIAIGEEVYRPGRDDSNERSPETLEQCARRFIPVDISLLTVSLEFCVRRGAYIPYDMGCFHEMPQQTRAALRHSQNPTVHPIRDDIDSKMGFSEQTRLQPRLHHVKRARNDGSGHATDPGGRGGQGQDHSRQLWWNSRSAHKMLPGLRRDPSLLCGVGHGLDGDGDTEGMIAVVM